MATRNGHLENALAILIQNQAQFVAEMAESGRRFARIEMKLDAIKRLLIQHDESLKDLTDAIRQKIGFKAKEAFRPCPALRRGISSRNQS